MAPLNPRRSRRAGITLIEMLVVITIIALFSAVAWNQLGGVADDSRKTAARAQIESFRTALLRYNLEKGNYPKEEEWAAAIRPYLSKDIPPDPWGNDYEYRFPGEHGPEPELISYGSDGQEGGEGNAEDIVSWK